MGHAALALGQRSDDVRLSHAPDGGEDGHGESTTPATDAGIGVIVADRSAHHVTAGTCPHVDHQVVVVAQIG